MSIKKLSIITVGYKNYNEIIKTMVSIDSQKEKPFENILVIKGLDANEKSILQKKFKKNYRSFIFDSDNSIFNAMNLGIKKSTGNFIFFLNSGDIFYSINSIGMILNNIARNKEFNYAFKTLQQYQNLKIIRDNEINYNGKFYPPPHQGFIAPLDKSLLYNEDLKVSADNDWMFKNIQKRKTIILNDILCIFQLGGQSTYPYIRTIYLFLIHENYKSLLRILLKFFISLFLTKKEYYKFIAKRRSFKYYESK